MRGKFEDLTGRRFGRLTVIELSNRRLGKKKIPAWDCICDCGTVCHPAGRRLREGRTISCGCYAREISGERLIRHNLRHGDHRGGPSPEYRTWTGIKARCSNPKVPCWKYYGGRGIGVCERWFNSFEVFLADMGRKPSPKHSIDRIDNDKGYSPVNCRWATAREQVLTAESHWSHNRDSVLLSR